MTHAADIRLFVTTLLLLAMAPAIATAQQPAQQRQIAEQPQDTQRSVGELSSQRPHYPHYRHWQVGDQMDTLDWERGVSFHWQGQGLRNPPTGYEWRALDGVFLLGNPTGAVIDVKPVNR